MPKKMVQRSSEDSNPLSLLEDAIDFAVYRIAVDSNDQYGGRVVMVSPSIIDIVGIEDPWCFESWFEHLHPDDLDRIVKANRQAWEKAERYDQSARYYNHRKAKWVWVRTISTPIFNSAGVLTHFTGVVLDITDQKATEINLKNHIAFEKLILSLSTRFINLPSHELDEAIDAALCVIGNFTEVDRAYVFQFSTEMETMSCTHEWCQEGIEPQLERLQDIDMGALSWSNQKLIQNGILHIPTVDDLPEEARNEKMEFQAQGIQSLLAVSMVYQHKVIGLLGFDAVRSKKTWSPNSYNLLQVVASIFSNAQENKRSQEALKIAHDELEQRVVERTDALNQAYRDLQTEVEQRKKTEESLKISQALYAEVFDHSPSQLFIQEVLPDGKFRVLRTNPAHQKGSGLPPEKIWGRMVDELVVPEVAQSIIQHYQDCITAGKMIEYEEQGPSPYWDLERIRTFRTTIAPVFDDSGNIVRLVGSSTDITEQKLAEKIIMERTREEAIFNERGRLARELHDAVTQTLFSTTLTAEVLPKIWEKDPAQGRKKLDELRELTRGALAEMRTLLMELRPDALADADLNDLLRHLVNAFIARARIPTELQIEGECSLPLEVKIAFYRIAQEALNNIAKHSDPELVTIRLSRQEDRITLEVNDNGQGFDPEQVIGNDHYGLRIMQERADEVGASLEIQSQVGKGTRVHLWWNLNPSIDKG
jgi:PAS domain S-box-containing protein